MIRKTGDRHAGDPKVDRKQPSPVGMFGKTAIGKVADGVFSPDELTGLAVSDGFKASIKTDVAGSISTVLEAGDTVATGGTLTLQSASIAKLDFSTGNVAYLSDLEPAVAASFDS